MQIVHYQIIESVLVLVIHFYSPSYICPSEYFCLFSLYIKATWKRLTSSYSCGTACLTIMAFTYTLTYSPCYKAIAITSQADSNY